ncbi:serine hydrolase [Sporomusa acidovorans]|uniref:Beta-lactamase class A catalytic domain-containing protein n=1 Tax=Sporomusa acidovorans (strain ATCC 49682 / DSM 3132 / Mol) TaxID=1123286 RepID=A0ABZ3IZ17_SPOA4|nr:serine hydrolase [Sporomusa acidovorans]OZC18326.1 beta-lactamase precursor [Sporomusa acidovorans DSM 3132]SDF19914.1 beta-lactamase class A [Sporomusa acidovorans]
MLKKLIPLCIACIFAFSGVTASASSALEKEITNDLKQFNGQVGVFAKNLKTGKTIKYNQDTVFPTASTSKLIVALATYKFLYPKASSDKQAEYNQDVDLMIKVSDNNTFDELLNELDATKKEEFEEVERDLRLKKTAIHNEQAYKKYNYHSVTTPYEMSKVLESIYKEKYIEKKHVLRLKDDLANTIYNDEIPRYMQVPVFHKVGELDDVLCDVGVIQDGHDPILISFYTRTPDHSYSSDFIANVSAKLYNALRR